MQFKDANVGDTFKITAHDFVLTKVPYMSQSCCTPEHNASYEAGDEVHRVKINDEAEIEIVERAPEVSLSLQDIEEPFTEVQTIVGKAQESIVETTDTPPNQTSKEILDKKYRGGQFR